MKEVSLASGTELYVGIDIHKRSMTVTIQTRDVILMKPTEIATEMQPLLKLLSAYRQYDITAEYEAGFSGFWLCDALKSNGIDCIVTPPSLIPREVGNKV